MNDWQDYDPHDDFEDDDFDDGMDECGLCPDGQCTMAGSEYCDFECADRNGPYFAGNPMFAERHKAPLPLDDCDCVECHAARRQFEVGHPVGVPISKMQPTQQEQKQDG